MWKVKVKLRRILNPWWLFNAPMRSSKVFKLNSNRCPLGDLKILRSNRMGLVLLWLGPPKSTKSRLEVRQWTLQTASKVGPGIRTKTKGDSSHHLARVRMMKFASSKKSSKFDLHDIPVQSDIFHRGKRCIQYTLALWQWFNDCQSMML